MKPYIACVLFLLLLTSSCKFFKDQPLFKKGIDTLLENQVTIIEDIKPDTVIEPEPEPIPATAPKPNNKYFMIVGSFQVEKNAENLADELTDLGYSSEIHYSNHGFYRVSAKGYANYKVGIEEISMFRNSLTPNAWLLVKH